MKDNGKGIKQACREFIELYRQMNMFTNAIVAIDGSKFKAVNAKEKNYTPQKTKDRIALTEASIQAYMHQLDSADNKEVSDTRAQSIKGKVALLKQRLRQYKAIEATLEQQQSKQLSVTDPDARFMKTHHMNRKVCYNVQSAVDTKHHLIISHDVVQTVDRGQLTHMAKKVQQTLRNEPLTVLADKGYFSRLDI